MKFYEFTWRIIEKQIHQNHEGYYDVIHYVGYECLCDLKVVDDTNNTENYYSDTISGGMNIPFTPSDNFVGLPTVDDDTIFEWMINNGLDRFGVEDQLRAKINSTLPN